MLVSSMARVASMGRMLPEEALGGLEGVEEIVEPGVAVVTLGTVPVLHKGSEIRQVDELVVVDVHRLEDVEVSPHRLHQLRIRRRCWRMRRRCWFARTSGGGAGDVLVEALRA